ncbi:UNVERIFIED_CONTAM: Retrovirus-related Pol polyprotein from transposon TNT 1-94 [Sesamum latifolium]|uniref:Retrovirus-related Pol polyprotein from transposon TNT 1-94 n=1 Tax=Sesamum latifolium TaxID=2727402 RepID=A0AAW2U414_9LAMI
MELEPHSVATENHGSSHPSSGDPVAIESGGSSHPTSGGFTTNELHAYNLARDRQRRTNIKPPSRLVIRTWSLLYSSLVVTNQPPSMELSLARRRRNGLGVMVEEMKSLQKNHTWVLVQLPEGKKAIGCKWVYKKKPTVSKEEGEKFKAQLVAKGYSQQKGIYYDEIFSPVVRHTSIRAILAVVASWDLHLEQMDVKITFLHGYLEEQIYMEQPDGFTQPRHEHLGCKLKKSLYGLKQSPRQWYKRFNSFMLQIGYKLCEYDCCVYVKSLDDGSFIFLLLYVDDMLIAAKNMHDVLALKALLSQEFDMKDLDAATKILGMQVHRDRGYVEKVLDRFGMSKTKPVSTPLANHFKLFS